MTLTKAYPQIEQIAKGLGIEITGRNFRLLIEIWKLHNKVISLQK